MDKGYTQQEGIDYENTFSSCEIQLYQTDSSYSCKYELGVTSNGCKDCILNGELHEEIYMEQPFGFFPKFSTAQSLHAQKVYLWT